MTLAVEIVPRLYLLNLADYTRLCLAQKKTTMVAAYVTAV
jgi:hypothetical protein